MKAKSGILILFGLFSIINSKTEAQQSTFTKVFYDPAGGVQGYAICKHRIIIICLQEKKMITDWL